MLKNTHIHRNILDVNIWASFIDDCLTITECNLNALMQSKADTKKLELNDTKCYKMHVGSDKTLCPKLKIHSQEMLTTEQEKYLGDIVTSDTKIDKNIKMRHDKGIGISNQIMSILKEVSFGIYHFEMGLLFRTSLLINGILFNTEVIHNLTDKHVTQLEECDRFFMLQLFDAEAGTPVESFYIETSTLPIRQILMGRKSMYYHTLLRKSESEFVKRVFMAQDKFPSKNKSDCFTSNMDASLLQPAKRNTAYASLDIGSVPK